MNPAGTELQSVIKVKITSCIWQEATENRTKSWEPKSKSAHIHAAHAHTHTQTLLSAVVDAATTNSKHSTIWPCCAVLSSQTSCTRTSALPVAQWQKHEDLFNLRHELTVSALGQWHAQPHFCYENHKISVSEYNKFQTICCFFKKKKVFTSWHSLLALPPSLRFPPAQCRWGSLLKQRQWGTLGGRSLATRKETVRRFHSLFH